MRIADLTLRSSFALQNLKILTVQMLKTQKANKENPVYFVLQKLKFSNFLYAFLYALKPTKQSNNNKGK